MGEGRADSAAKWAQLGGAVGGVAGMVYGWVVSTEVKTAKHALEAFTWGGGGALCGAAVGGLVGLLLGRRSAVRGLITRPLPVLNPEFTDRDEDLGWLRSGAPVAGRSSPVVQVLAGLSGTGKSQIAGRYLQEQDAAGVRWWHVPGDALREVFVGAAGLFDDVVIPTGEGVLLAERVLAARSVFEQTRYPWLLVLDDVVDGGPQDRVAVADTAVAGVE